MLTTKLASHFSQESFLSEINQLQNRLFLFLNFPRAAILNNCQELLQQLPYCYCVDGSGGSKKQRQIINNY